MGRHSQIQQQVLSLYKQFLKVAKAKPGLDGYIRSEFRNNAKTLSKMDTLHIEHLLRRGQRQLQMLKGEQVKGMDVFKSEQLSPK